jgi:Tfp pilus assembly protein PilO
MVGVLYFIVTSLLGVVIWGAKAIFTGDLVPRKSVEFIANGYKEQLESKKTEAAEWKSHYEAERALSVNSRENRDILLAVSKTMEKVLGSLPTTTVKDANVGG